MDLAMSTLGAQIDGIKVLARVLSPHHLMRSGAVARESEAHHLCEMLKDAAKSLEEARDRGEVD
jgi:hypothetical protein